MALIAPPWRCLWRLVDDGFGVDAGEVGEQFRDVRRREDDAQPLVAVGVAQELDVERAQHVSVLVRLAERVDVVVDAGDDLSELARLAGQYRRCRQEAELLLDDVELEAVQPSVAQRFQRRIDRHPGERPRFALRGIRLLEGRTLEGDEDRADEQRAVALGHAVDVQRVVELLDEHLQRAEVLPVLGVVVAVAAQVVLGVSSASPNWPRCLRVGRNGLRAAFDLGGRRQCAAARCRNDHQEQPAPHAPNGRGIS